MHGKISENGSIDQFSLSLHMYNERLKRMKTFMSSEGVLKYVCLQLLVAIRSAAEGRYYCNRLKIFHLTYFYLPAIRIGFILLAQIGKYLLFHHPEASQKIYFRY